MGINNTNCCVFGCHSRKSKSTKLSFHRFPRKNERSVYITTKLGVTEKVDRHTAWVMKLKMLKPATPYLSVCSLHFRKDDFYLPDVPTQRPRLRACAVPSQNIPEINEVPRWWNIDPEFLRIERQLELRMEETSTKIASEVEPPCLSMETEFIEIERQLEPTARALKKSSKIIRDIEVSNSNYTVSANRGVRRKKKEIQVSSGDDITDKELNIKTESIFNTTIVSMCKEIIQKFLKKTDGDSTSRIPTTSEESGKEILGYENVFDESFTIKEEPNVTSFKEEIDIDDKTFEDELKKIEVKEDVDRYEERMD